MEPNVTQIFTELFSPAVIAQPKSKPKKVTKTKSAAQQGLNEVKDAASEQHAPACKYHFTYLQMKKVSELFEQKLNKKFWINLSKEQQENEKTTPTNIEYYRLAYTVYNDFPLFNIVRYHPDKSRVPKGKAFATINLKTCKCTMNSQNKFVLTDSEITIIKDTLNLEPKTV